MPSFVGYKFDGDVLTISLPISTELMRDGINSEAVAELARRLAGDSAHTCVLQRCGELRDEEDN